MRASHLPASARTAILARTPSTRGFMKSSSQNLNAPKALRAKNLSSFLKPISTMSTPAASQAERTPRANSTEKRLSFTSPPSRSVQSRILHSDSITAELNTARSFAQQKRRDLRRVLCKNVYSHSIVAGGFDEISSTTRLTPLTSFMILLEIFARISCGICAQSAVIASWLSTILSAITLS